MHYLAFAPSRLVAIAEITRMRLETAHVSKREHTGLLEPVDRFHVSTVLQCKPADVGIGMKT